MPDWEALYQSNDTGWDRGDVSPAFHIWLQQGGLNQGSKVLVPGCGRGHEVVAFAKHGFEVTGLDMAPSAIRALENGLARAGVKAKAECVDIFEYQTAETFDVVYEQTCLCAIQPEERPLYALRLKQWLKPGGKLLFSMMQTGESSGPPYHCELLEMRGLFDDQSWEWADEPPFVIPRGYQSKRFELGFTLKRKEERS